MAAQGLFIGYFGYNGIHWRGTEAASSLGTAVPCGSNGFSLNGGLSAAPVFDTILRIQKGLNACHFGEVGVC